MKAKLSYHCMHRIIGRTGLPIEEVESILDNDLCVPTGRSFKNQDVAYKLFYSLSQKCYFVALQNELTGVVVTLLPMSYCNRLRIQPDAMRMARELVDPLPPPPKKALKAKSVAWSDLLGETGRWHVSAHVERRDGRFQHIVLGSPIAYGTQKAADIAADPEFQEWIFGRLMDACEDGDRVMAVGIRKRQHDTLEDDFFVLSGNQVIEKKQKNVVDQGLEIMAYLNEHHPVEA